MSYLLRWVLYSRLGCFLGCIFVTVSGCDVATHEDSSNPSADVSSAIATQYYRDIFGFVSSALRQDGVELEWEGFQRIADGLLKRRVNAEGLKNLELTWADIVSASLYWTKGDLTDHLALDGFLDRVRDAFSFATTSGAYRVRWPSPRTEGAVRAIFDETSDDSAHVLVLPTYDSFEDEQVYSAYLAVLRMFEKAGVYSRIIIVDNSRRMITQTRAQAIGEGIRFVRTQDILRPLLGPVDLGSHSYSDIEGKGAGMTAANLVVLDEVIRGRIVGPDGVVSDPSKVVIHYLDSNISNFTDYGPDAMLALLDLARKHPEVLHGTVVAPRYDKTSWASVVADNPGLTTPELFKLLPIGEALGRVTVKIRSAFLFVFPELAGMLQPLTGERFVRLSALLEHPHLWLESSIAERLQGIAKLKKNVENQDPNLLHLQDPSENARRRPPSRYGIEVFLDYVLARAHEANFSVPEPGGINDVNGALRPHYQAVVRPTREKKVKPDDSVHITTQTEQVVSAFGEMIDGGLPEPLRRQFSGPQDSPPQINLPSLDTLMARRLLAQARAQDLFGVPSN